VNRRNHLTDKQIELYTSGTSSAARNQPLERHVATCALCQSRILESAREKLGVQETGPGSQVPTPECPSEESLQKFAVGMSSPETAEQIMEHVADCAYCAPMLKIYLDAIDDMDPEPVPVPDPLPGPFHDVISHLRSFLQPPLLPKIAWATGLGGIVFTCIAAGPPVINAFKLNRAQSTLAAAFKESRPSPMRVLWGPYAEVDVRRGGKRVPISELPTLAEAARIAGKEKDASDPRWIRFRGRVKLLADEQDAPQLLTTAAEKGLNDPNTEIDLAVAYFQKEIRASANSVKDKSSSSLLNDQVLPMQGAENNVKSGTSPNLGQSLELLNKVLREPNLSEEQREVALFDLAIVYEKMLFWDQAIPIWERYLALDPAGPWHEEAQRHYEKAKSNIRPAKSQDYRDPAYFLRGLEDPAIQASLEEYQDFALRTWAVEAVKNPESEAARAIQTLVALLEERNGDLWMKDFFHILKPRDKQGVQALGDAITNNRQGQYTKARKQAQDAAQLFVQSRNHPGWLRATFEEIYADQRLLEETRCLGQAQILADKLVATQYRWLQVQTALEQAVCRHFAVDFTTALKKLEVGRRSAADANFNMLGLRAQSLEAAIWVSHNCNITWQQVQAGLEQYWQGPIFPLRLYDFYSAAKQCFEKNQLWYAAEALERHMIIILEREMDRNDENILLEVTAHRALEQILRELGDHGAAQDQAHLALLLLDRVDKAIVAKYEIPIKLELADLQLDSGDTEGALATIQEADQRLKDTQNTNENQSAKKIHNNQQMSLGLLRVRGDIQLKRQHVDEAAEAYKEALLIAEKGLRKEKDRRQWVKETSDVYRGLVEVFLEQKRDQEALQFWQWYQARPAARESAFEANLEPQWEDIEEAVLRQPLPSVSSTRLVYASTRNRLYIWQIGTTGIKTVWVPEKREDLRKKIYQYIQKCGTPQSPSLPLPAPDDESRKLFSLLLQPVIADLSGSETVVVDLDQAMRGLPIEALKSPEGWYFGEKYPVVYSPGYIRENDLRNPAQQTPRGGVLLNAWDDSSEQPAVRELFPQIRIVYDEAIAPKDLAVLLEPSEMFVFIGHGEAGSLILHSGRPLKAEDFPPESLKRLQLVVLAGCSTGSSPDGILDTRNLLDAFQAGGTPSVIASQWDVESTITTDLMTRFYTHLKNGESVPHALYEARKEIIRQKPYSHPYYWAGFILNGRPS
jgi:CHAT domain-containing protein